MVSCSACYPYRRQRGFGSFLENLLEKVKISRFIWNPLSFCLVRFLFSSLILHQKGIGFLIFLAFLKSYVYLETAMVVLWTELRKLKHLAIDGCNKK